MAKHTEGAVHLTSLDLDLTKFQENIQQIQASTAEVADVAVQNLGKIKEALNIPTEQVRLSIDTEQLTRDMSSAQASVEGLGNAVRSVSKTIQAGQLYDVSSIEKLKTDLGLTGEAAKDAQTKLEKFFNEVKGYDKITFSTSGGKLFQAIIETSDESGKSIRKVIDLTKEFDAKLLDSFVRVTDNAQKRNAEIERQNENYAKSLNAIIDGYDKLYAKINKSTVNEKDNLLLQLEDERKAILKVQEYLRNRNTAMDSKAFEVLFKGLKEDANSLSNAFDQATTAQKKMLSDEKLIDSLSKKYEQLQSKIASMTASLTSAKFDNVSTESATKALQQLETAVEKEREALTNIGVNAQEAAGKFEKLASSANALNVVMTNLGSESGVIQKFERLVDPISKVSKEYDMLVQKINKSDLDIDSKDQLLKSITNAQEEIGHLKESIAEVSVTASKSDFKAQYDNVANTFKNISQEIDNAIEAQKQLIREAKEQISSENLATKLSTDYAHLQNQLLGLMRQMQSVDIPDNVLNEARILSQEMEQTADDIRKSGVAANDASATYKQFAESVAQVAEKLGRAKLSQAEYEKAIQPTITTTKEAISSLKTLEKSAVFSTSKKKVAELRAEYEEFLNRLKNTRIGTEKAQEELGKLQAKFEQLENTVKRGNGTLENWVNKITESAKWQIANSALNLLQQSFGQLTTTIIDTETATIELQRVLNDKNLSSSAISDELYQIAYDFGQTFDAVQSTAVKFAQTGMEWTDVVEATRATMLGLNTAELEVETATQGLIAVMAQFGKDASELEAVIDKINITADNFPVTSEKIVAALQRAGGTANAFGLSLEETIGIITALGAATGRTGEAIGTAMNSLIAFSMKGSALEKFSEFLGQDVSNFGVLELWQTLAEEIEKGNTSLATMMSTSEEFNDLMDEELASSIGLTEELTKAQEETNRMTKEGMDIYSTVGTYRQNYFIALLKNIQMATDAIQNMSGAVGYSMRENETAMEAFSKKWNQLIISAKELAIQFGESGFLDLMKLVVDASSGVLKLTKNIGGLNTVLGFTAAIIISIKKEKIKDRLMSLGNVFTNLTQVINAYNTAMSLGYTKTEAMKIAISGLQLTTAGLIGVIGLAVTAIGALGAAHDKYIKEQRQAREETISSAQASVDTFEAMGIAYQKYVDAQKSGASSDIQTARNELLASLGYEEDDVTALISIYGDEKKAIQELIKEKYELMQLDVQAGYEAIKSEEKLKEVAQNRVEVAQSDREYLERLTKAGYDYSNVISELDRKLEQSFLGMNLGGTEIELKANIDFGDIDQVKEEVKRLNKELEKYESVMTAAERKNSSMYQSTLKTRNAYQSYIVEVERLKELYENSQLSLDEYTQKLLEAKDNAESSAESTATMASNLEELDKAIDNLNKKMDTFQSSVNTVQKIIEEYNQTGIMTADMLQDLIGLSPEYIDLIDQNSGALELNQEKLENLMLTNDNYMIQMAAMKVARETEATITELQKQKYDELTASEIVASMTTEALGGVVYEAALQFLTGKINANQFEDAIRGFGEQAGLSANKLEALGTTIGNLTGKYKDFINVAGMVGNLAVQSSKKIIDGKELYEWQNDRLRGIISEAKFQDILNRANKGLYDDVVSQKPTSSGTKTWFPFTTSSKTGGSKSSADPYKEEKEALDDLLSSYEHAIFLIEKNEKTSQSSADKIVAIYRKMQAEVHKQAEYYRAQGIDENDEMITKLSEQWWQYQETIEETLRGVYDATVNTFENAINMLEHQYESAEQRLDYSYMGENLKKQLDYQVKIQKEAERELERLSKKGIDVNDDAAQEVINRWYEAEKAIREISQKIAADILEPYDDFIDLADKFDIWEYMDFTKVDYLRDKLAAVNKLLQEGTISFKQYNEELKNISYAIFDAQKDLYEKEKEEVSRQVKSTTEAYKAQIDALKNRKDEVSDYYDSVIKGYNKEIETWEKRKEEVENYYDTLIDGLRDVEKANDRINKQLDYYNERQKIITNIEQAQSRSGVEWREKEMEYQQNLIDLDEEWRRTLEEWSVEDQIEAIEKLKEAALKDIDLSIQKIRDTITVAEEAKNAALEGIEAQIKGIEDMIDATEKKAEQEIEQIDNKIKDLSKTIADAIKSGTEDGLVNSKAELDKALVDSTNAMLEFIDKNQTAAQNSAKATATNAYGIYTQDFLQPMTKGIDEIASHMKNALTSGVTEGAKGALDALEKNLIAPLRDEMANIMKQTQSAKNTVATSSRSPSAIRSTSNTSTSKTNSDWSMYNTGTQKVPSPLDFPNAWETIRDFPKRPVGAQVYISNYNYGLENAANKTAKNLHDILGT